MMKQITPKAQLESYTLGIVLENERRLINMLIYVGKACVNEARDNGGYTDQTGNLKSSIGFMVLNDGLVIQKGGFKLVKKGSKGKKEGAEYISQLVSQHNTGLVLLVVAGMNYASYVESMNLNVVTSGELLSEQMIPKMLNKLGFNKHTA
jgi:3-oxoacyl-ACP reductase-like protein